MTYIQSLEAKTKRLETCLKYHNLYGFCMDYLKATELFKERRDD